MLDRLAADTDRVLAKAQWLQAYWSETVACNGVFERIEPGFTPRYTSRGPTIMHRRIVGGGGPSAPTQASLVTIAQARGWNEITVRGTERFRKEAWTAARARPVRTGEPAPVRG